MKQRFIALIITAFLLSGCGATLPPSTEPSSKLPSQEISTQVPKNEYRVIFFNDSGILHKIDATDMLQIRINDEYYGQIGSKEYIQLFLKKGSYQVGLLHNDMFAFRSKHTINVEKDMYVKVGATITSNKLTVVDAPAKFSETFKAAYWE